jgi:hypothetical protein
MLFSLLIRNTGPAATLWQARCHLQTDKVVSGGDMVQNFLQPLGRTAFIPKMKHNSDR